MFILFIELKRVLSFPIVGVDSRECFCFALSRFVVLFTCIFLAWTGWDGMPIHHSRSLKPLLGFRFSALYFRFSLPVVTFKKESISEYPLSSFAAFYIHSITIISLSCGITRDINKSSMTVTPTTTYRHPFLILTQSFHIVPSSKRFHNTPH